MFMQYRIEEFFSANNLMYLLQFGFRQKYSAVLAFITESIRINLDGGNTGCGIFVDLQEAFDTVEHHILLSKWFKSFKQKISQIESNTFESMVMIIILVI